MTPVLRSVCIGLLGLLLAVLSSCSRENPLRKPTWTVTGRVFVDGEPAANVSVVCRGVGGIDTEHPTVSAALTDQEGRFALSTYESGDGVPEGAYLLAIEWRDYTPFTGSYDGPDRLNGRYEKGEALGGRTVVVRGEPIDLGRIDLATE